MAYMVKSVSVRLGDSSENIEETVAFVTREGERNGRILYTCG
jgi:hypothetical protein